MKSNKKISVLNAWETSKYWMGSDITQKLEDDRGSNLTELAGFQRAIANFVRITTGKEIPVRFNTKDSSYTDGSSIVLSAKMDEKLFDCNVGLALHEGSHILLTDFKWTTSVLENREYEFNEKLRKVFEDAGYTNLYYSAYTTQFLAIFKDLLNVIEDRRIDFHVYNNAPGYRGYYLAMYSNYFNSAAIDTALRYNLKNEETYEHYLFHLINIMNPNRNLKALKKLQMLWNVIDLHNIGRLTSTQDAANVALQIMEILADEIIASIEPTYNKQPDKLLSGKGDTIDGNNTDGSTKSGDESDDADRDSDDSNEDADNDGAETDGSDDNPLDRVDSEPSALDMTPAEKKLVEKSLEKAMQAQKDFLAGKTTKSTVSRKEITQLDALASSNVEMHDVNVNGKRLAVQLNLLPEAWIGSSKDYNKVKCIYINKISEASREAFPHCFTGNSTQKDKVFAQIAAGTTPARNRTTIERNYIHIQKGLRLGAMLGKKLKVRNEERSLASTRLRDGRIDKRLIAEIGYGAEAVFSKLITKTVNPVHIHCSIDASGSMMWNKWDSAITAATAIAKACSMISGVTMMISFRTTAYIGHECVPVVVVGYDSTKNNIASLYNTLIYMTPSGSTPEGLCFEALHKTLKSNLKNNAEGLFINISDGQPGFSTNTSKTQLRYGGEYALEHTKRQVNDIRNLGYNVLSYFVSENKNHHSTIDVRSFTTMYGKSAQFVDPTDLLQLTKTINGKLLEPTAV